MAPFDNVFGRSDPGPRGLPELGQEGVKASVPETAPVDDERVRVDPWRRILFVQVCEPSQNDGCPPVHACEMLERYTVGNTVLHPHGVLVDSGGKMGHGLVHHQLPDGKVCPCA